LRRTGGQEDKFAIEASGRDNSQPTMIKITPLEEDVLAKMLAGKSE
jgi:hypothetical protein